MKRFWVLFAIFVFVILLLLTGCVSVNGRSLYSPVSRRGPAFLYEGEIGIDSYSYASNIIVLENTTDEPVLVVMSGHRFGAWSLSPHEERRVGFRNIYGQVSFACKFKDRRGPQKIYMDFDRGPRRRRISISRTRCWGSKDRHRHRWWWR